MVKSVDKRLYKNYLLKAEEMLEIARHAGDTAKYNAAVISSIHSSINALDALSVFYLGGRHAGSHENALTALKASLIAADFEDLTKQFGGLIELKNQAEYQPDLMGERDAADAIKRASRIFSKVRQKLPDI